MCTRKKKYYISMKYLRKHFIKADAVNQEPHFFFERERETRRISDIILVARLSFRPHNFSTLSKMREIRRDFSKIKTGPVRVSPVFSEKGYIAPKREDRIYLDELQTQNDLPPPPRPTASSSFSVNSFSLPPISLSRIYTRGI